MQWQTRLFSQLSVDELYKLLKLRVDIFVVEQQCAYPELDDKDKHPQAIHLLGLDDNQLVAYCRILPPTLSYKESSIGRVAIASSHRGRGLATPLMQKAIMLAKQQWPEHAIQIGAQEYLTQFYQGLGFVINSAVYLEDGIPHLDMIYHK